MTDPHVEAPITGSARGSVLAGLALAGAALVVLFAVVPHGIYGDGYVRFVKLDELLRHGTISGARYSYIGPLFASPLWVFGDARLWWAARFNVVVLAVCAIATWRALRSAATPAERTTSVMLLAAAGMMPNATLDFYGELFSAATVGTGLLFVTLRHSWPGWIAVVLGVANMPASGAGLLLIAVWRWWRTRRFDGLAAAALAAVLILGENMLVRGAPFDGGYFRDRGLITVMPFSGMPGFSYPFIFGLFSLLFSFGKGVLFFAPGLLLILHARRQRPQLGPFFELSIAYLAGLLLVYSSWWAWYGGWKWGPRFLLFASYPSSVAIAIALNRSPGWPRRLAALAIACWTIWVGISGVVFDLAGLDQCIANGYALEHLCWFVPDFSPLLRPFVLPPGELVLWQKVWMMVAALAAALLITARPDAAAARESNDRDN